MSKKRIGFLSYFGFPRGLAYGTLMYCKMLQEDYDIYILKQGLNPISEEFKSVKVNITEYPEYIVDKKFFTNWIKENKLDAVVFNEYKQWTNEPDNLVQVAKSLGARTYGYLVLEKLDKKQTDDYDRIIAPTVSYMRSMRFNKVRHFTYIPHSIDLTEFPKTMEVKRSDKFTFFHPAGYGGFLERKNTSNVIRAFEALDTTDAKLIITTQKKLEPVKVPNGVELISRNLSRKELIEIYYKSDAVVLPSKWETVGFPILEALAAGKPVITTNVPPMNEFIRVGLNGYLCGADFVTYPEIKIKAAEVGMHPIKVNMENMMNKDLYPMLSRNSRYIAEKIYDLEKNKKYFLEFLKKDLKCY